MSLPMVGGSIWCGKKVSSGEGQLLFSQETLSDRFTMV